MSQLYCEIPMTVFASSPYSLSPNTLIEAHVLAQNVNGWSDQSVDSSGSAIAQTTPLVMNDPTRDILTTTSQIVVDWAALTLAQSGYSAVTSYNLMWDAGTNAGQWYSLLGNNIDTTALTFTVSSTLISGRTYNFKLRAKNIWGWGPFSNIIAIKASTYPSVMQPVTTSIDSTTGGVKIEWTAPSSNSDPITQYKI